MCICGTGGIMFVDMELIQFERLEIKDGSNMCYEVCQR